MDALCNFATSNVQEWRDEALHAADLRDRTWLAFYQVMDQTPLIELEALIAQLPPLEWPE